MSEVIKVGRHPLPVVPQKHARLRHNLSAADFQALMSSNYGHEAYRVLGILIPQLHQVMPEWEFQGFGSEEAWKSDAYDEALDNGPTTAEIVEAFKQALIVNGAGELGKIIDLVKMGQNAMEAQQTQTTSEQQTPTSLDSLGVNGESHLTPTGTSLPTTPESPVSPGSESLT
ncbi:MAG: hypothetical protein H0U53_10850 [Actinobacteria bacterium]|nr:hypothetical protein [Actinomycetota bacterium]